MKSSSCLLCAGLVTIASMSCADKSVCPRPILSTDPALAATNVAVDSIVTAVFTQNVNGSNLGPKDFVVEGVAADLTYKCSAAFLRPVEDLSPGTRYSTSIDVCGEVTTWTFTTASAGLTPLTARHVSASGIASFAVGLDGTLWAWGDNTAYQLGDGTRTSRTVPTQVGADTDWTAVNGSACLKTDGTLWTWGSDDFGQLGDGTTTFRASPAQVGTDSDWSTVASGAEFVLAVKSDGTMWSWGLNQEGQLGDGTTVDHGTPIQVGTDTDWSAVSAGLGFSLALKTNGTLWAWGSNDQGQLGDGTRVNRSIPAQVGTDTDWGSISAGYHHVVALRTDGSLWGWGNGNVATPTRAGTDTGGKAVSAGRQHDLGIRQDGTLWAAGLNDRGQVGDGTTEMVKVPAQIGSDTDWSEVSAGFAHSLAIKTDGTVWAWGSNDTGQLGDGTTIQRNAPVPVRFRSPKVPLPVQGLSATAGDYRIDVAWAPVPGATSYDIVYSWNANPSPDPDSTPTVVRAKCVTSPHGITGLKAGLDVAVRVVASNGYGNSPDSDYVTATPTKPTGGGGGGGDDCPDIPCGQIQNGIEVEGAAIPADCECPGGTHLEYVDTTTPGGPYNFCLCNG